MAFSAVNRRAS